MFALVLVAGLAVPVTAADFAGVAPVSNARLANLRGGFAIGSGRSRVRVSFGIERLSFINGELAAVTQLGAATDSGVHVIQNGPGNLAAAQLQGALPSGSLATVIQNTLDGQTISNVNLYNVNVTSLQSAQALAMHESLVGALALTP